MYALKKNRKDAEAAMEMTKEEQALIKRLEKLAVHNDPIKTELYTKYDVYINNQLQFSIQRKLKLFEIKYKKNLII